MAKWLRAIWRGRGKVEPDAWRLYFVVVVDGHPVGMQELIGVDFSTFGTVTSFSWLVDNQRGRGLGHEMRAAILHLAFDGLGAKEASSDAFVDNHGSNAISRDRGYEPNGSDWATRQGEPALLNRWRLAFSSDLTQITGSGFVRRVSLLVGLSPGGTIRHQDDRPEGEGVTGPFTRADLDEVAALVVSSWRSGVDRDWTAPAGTLSWSCAKTADHTVDAVLAVAIFLASRKQDGYPDWGWGEFSMGADPRPDDLVEALETVTRILSAVIAAAEPGAGAVIWRRPQVVARPAADFAARGALELILHGHDVCAGLGVEFEPPAALSRRLRDHTRDWPHWTTPGWSAPRATGDPWSDLLMGAGRRRTG